MIALHDLWFATPGQLGLAWAGPSEGEATEFTADSIMAAGRRIASLRRLNSHLVILAEIRYRDAPSSYLPKNSSYWMRDASGRRVNGWKEGHFFRIDFDTPPMRALLARRARALVATGFIDGVMLDWWNDDPAGLALVQNIRRTVGDRLILVNTNGARFPRTAGFINGAYMECPPTQTPQDWTRISQNLRWSKQHTRAPHIDCLEICFHRSRRDFDLMRAATTLTLTQSNGYCLFGDPDDLPTSDHLHDWYPFWDKGLGTPVSLGVEQADKSWRREFTNGVVIYNPASNPAITADLKAPHLSRSSGQVMLQVQVPAGDGDILIRH